MLASLKSELVLRLACGTLEAKDDFLGLSERRERVTSDRAGRANTRRIDIRRDVIEEASSVDRMPDVT